MRGRLLLRASSVLATLLAACAPPSPGVQRAAITGKDGPKAVAGTEIVNRYTALAVGASGGDSSLIVADATGFGAGDLVLLVSAQGASMDTADDTPAYGGSIGFGSAGLHEFWALTNVAGNTLTLNTSCSGGLASSYPLASKPQVIRVPQYSTLSVPGGTILTGSPWNGTTGGFVVVDVESTAQIDGLVDANNLGFRGGQVSLGSTGLAQTPSGYLDTNPTGGEKGESIAGSQADYDGIGGRYGRGAPANGGGGGNGYLAGGGGGAGVDGAGGSYSGQGTMGPGNATAWAQDPNAGSSGGPGGGRGGYSFSAIDAVATSDGPGSTLVWGGNGRQEAGGLGGHPLVASSRLFLGGGGGMGGYHDAGSTLPASIIGANGGGVVYVISDTIAGTGTLRADGGTGRAGLLVGTGNALTISDGGGAGGGGGGGMVVVRAAGTTTLVTSAQGGAGGNLAITGDFAGSAPASGPGGGGAGGGIVVGSGLTVLSTSVAGALGGNTSAPALSEFTPNGASTGDSGVVTTGVAQTAPPFACLPADLSITLADSADPVDVSTGFNYTATITNNGPNAAYDLTATIVLPSGVVAGAPTAPGWTCNLVGQTLTCQRAFQLSGVVSTIQLACTAPSTVGTLVATSQVTSREDLNGANNSMNASTTYQLPPVDLALTQSGPSATASGETYVYTLSVKNNGPRNAPSLTVTDPLPAGVTFQSFSGAGWSCSAAGATVTCTFGALASGGTAAVNVTVLAPAFTSPTGINNTGTVAVGGVAADPVGGNNSSSVATTITPVNLSITKIDATDPVPASSAITYTITVANPASVAAHSIVVDDPLPAGTAFVSATGSGWTCSLVTTTVHCTNPISAASPTPTPPITIIVTAPSMQGVIANTATVTSTATDPALANNTATEQTTISPPAPGSADLSVGIAAIPNPVDINTTLTYTVTAANAGPDPADGAQIIATLPAGATFMSAIGTGWTCTNGMSTVTCGATSMLAVGPASPITIVVTAPSTPEMGIGSAVILAITPDPAVGNNSASVETDVVDPTLINQPPTVKVPLMLSTLEDTALSLSGSDAPSIDDTDADGMAVELHIVASGCVLSLSKTTGLDLVVGDGVFDPELRIRGTIDDINAALDGSTLTPDRDFNGAAELMLTIDDLGNTGTGGSMTATGTLSVVVLPVDDPPTAAPDEITVTLGDPPTKIDVLANDSSGDPEQQATIVSVAPAEHGSAVISADGKSIVYTLDERFFGDDHFQYTMSDGTTQATATVTVHVVPPPVPDEVHLVGGGIGCGVAPGAASSDGLALVVLLLFGLGRGFLWRARTWVVARAAGPAAPVVAARRLTTPSRV